MIFRARMQIKLSKSQIRNKKFLIHNAENKAFILSDSPFKVYSQ
jgi:hypothetical protein